MTDSVTYIEQDNSMVLVEPQGWSVPQPCYTWHQEYIDEWLAEGNTIAPWINPLSTVDGADSAKLAELKTVYKQEAATPVPSYGTVWNGGEASAHRINGKAETMIHQDTSLGEIHDIDNIPHEMDAISMKDIAANISVAYEIIFKHYQSKKNEVAFCVNDPDVVDKVSCINAVTW